MNLFDPQFYLISVSGIFYAFYALICAIFILFFFVRRESAVSRALIWTYVATMIWSLGMVFESSGTTLEVKMFWSKIAYIGTLYTAPLFFSFVLVYTRKKVVMTVWQWVLLLVIPTITLFCSWFFPETIWREVVINPVTNLAVYYHSFVFLIFYVYTYVLVVYILYLLLKESIILHRIYRLQANLLLLSVLITVLGNILYLVSFNPIPGFEWTLAGFLIATLIMSYNVVRFKLGSMIPVARGLLVENLHDGIILIDEKGWIKDINAAFIKLLELKPEIGYIKQNAFVVFSQQPEMLELLKKDIENYSEKLVMHRGSRVFDITTIAVDSEDLFAKARMFVFKDISVFKHTESQLNETNKTLSQQIVKSEKLIEELDRYAHTVAHDLKTPLSGVAGLSELIKMQVEDGSYDDLAENAELVLKTSSKLMHIVDELLLLSSVRSGKVSPRSVDMKAVFVQAIEQLNLQIEDSSAKVILPDQWYDVVGYAPWLRELVVNLISNALKYGGAVPEVEVSCSQRENTITYFVCDNGEGIPEELILKLFEPFSRMAPDKAEGTGLGLSIVKRIIDRLDGTIVVENRPKSGACFSFTLPKPSNNAGENLPESEIRTATKTP